MKMAGIEALGSTSSDMLTAQEGIMSDLIDIIFDVMPKDEHPLLKMIKHGAECSCDHCKQWREVLREADDVSAGSSK